MLRTVPLFRIVGALWGIMGLCHHGAAQSASQQAGTGVHCLMLPIEPGVRAQQSGLIVEAEILDARSFWDAGHRRLFTRHRLRVFSMLKGTAADTAGLQLITEGGRLGLEQQVLTNTLRLASGQQGVFFLTPAPWPGVKYGRMGNAWTPYGSEQGFIEYNAHERTASEPFRTYPAIDSAFYQNLAKLSGQPRQVLRPNPALLVPASPAQRGTLAPTISDFAPRTLAAGAEAVLTISGNGFGSSRGTGFVEFKNADDGGATRVQARAADYLTWTNTRIQVLVPSSASGGQPVSGGRSAGSGTIRVTTATQEATESSSVLTVVYALTNVESTDGNIIQRPNHVALNSTGGITFRYGPNFVSRTAAVAAWQRALVSWRCSTGVNWEVGTPSPANTIASDNENVVAFDAGSELPARVLGRTTSYYLGCFAPNGEVVFRVKEIDMQFDDGTNFQFGPAPALRSLNQIDFETVALHELGHAQQLSHLNLPGAVMHFGVDFGQNTRSLNAASDVAGGRQVLRGRSFRDLGCGAPAMLPAPLTSFGAQYVAPGTVLTWNTRDECLLSRFVIERSLSGDTTAWETIGTVAARPPASQYQFTDAQALGGLHYYRLQVVRPDASRDYVAPALISTEGAAASVSIFPNPVTGNELRLQYPAAAAGAVVLRCYDDLGRQVRAVSVAAVAGLNVLSLPIASLRPGIYVLHWRDAQGRHGSQKFVRQ